MRYVALALAVLLCLSQSTVGADAHGRDGGPCAPPQPLRDLPEGWMHLPTYWTDQWRGAYHDARSGAYVSYYTGSRNDARTRLMSRRGDVTETGVLAGVRYRLQSGPDARSRIKSLYTRGPVLVELDPGEWARQLELLLPSPDARLLRVVFEVGKKDEWVFEAATYDAEQAERVRSLLLSSPRLWTAADPCDMAWRNPINVTWKACQGVNVGDTVVQGFSALGPPDTVRQSSRDGFAIVYSIRPEGDTTGRVKGSASFDFGREQRVTKKNCETFGPSASGQQ
jgi:hypothetical protein